MICAAVLSIACLSQTVQFQNRQPIYVEVAGTRQQLIRFYEDWRDECDPEWKHSKDAAWWSREHERIIDDSKSGKILYRYGAKEKRPLWLTIVRHDCLVWFEATMTPFGSIHVPYKCSVHILLTIVFLVVVIVWMKRRKKRM